MLSAAPVAVADSYRVPNDGVLVAGALEGELAPRDFLPDTTHYTVDEVLHVTDGNQRQHPGFLTLGGQPLHYGKLLVADAGSKLTVNQYLEVGYAGFGSLFVSGDGLLHTTNWTEIGEARGGTGIGQVTGAGSQWINDNFLVIGDNGGQGQLTVDAGATVHNGNHLTIGQNGATGMLTVTDGAAFINNNWTEIAEQAGSQGELVVRGTDSVFLNREWMEIGGSGEAVATIMDGGHMEVGGGLQIYASGRLRGDGSVRSGMLENHGVLEPGAPIGVLSMETSVTQLADGRLEMELEGTARGQTYDGLDIQGRFVADGTLDLKFVKGFAPRVGDRFEVVRAATIEGEFDQILIDGLEAGFSYQLTTDHGVIALTAVNDGVALLAPAAGGVLANDHDPDGDALSTILTQPPAKGSLQLHVDGTFRYVASANFDGQDSFGYIASDRFRRSEPVTVRITNAPPVARPDIYQAVEDEVFIAPSSVLANDSDDATNSQLTARLIAVAPGVGQFDFRSDGAFTYVPAANYAGNFTFHYVASDGLTESALTVGEVFVQGTSDPPTAIDDQFDVRSGATLEVFDHGLLRNDQELDGQADRLVVTAVGSPDPMEGTLELVRDGELIRGFRFRPAPRFLGEVTFPYTIRDPDGLESTANIVVRVTPPNHAPRASADGKSMTQDTTLQFPPEELLANDFDPDGDSLRVIAVGDASAGEVFFDDSDNLITYLPPAGFVGRARFTYTVADGHGGQAQGVVVVDVRSLVESLPGRVQGTGSLDGFERFFAFSADNRLDAPSGRLLYTDLERRLLFIATAVSELSIAPDGRQATFSGEGRWNGRSGYHFMVTIEDYGRDGRDRFRIQITRGDFQYDSLEFAEQVGRIDRVGNIRIQLARLSALDDVLFATHIVFDEYHEYGARANHRRRR